MTCTATMAWSIQAGHRSRRHALDHLVPGIAAVDLWDRVLREPWARDDGGTLVDASLRHHRYEVSTGVGALAWNAWVGDELVLRQVATHLAGVFERGPLPIGR